MSSLRENTTKSNGEHTANHDDVVSNSVAKKLDGVKDIIHSGQRYVVKDMDIPLAYREYMIFAGCDVLKRHLPDRNDNSLLSEATVFATNTFMPMYKGTLNKENVLPSKDMPFIQAPSMLSYWAQKQNCPVIHSRNELQNGNSMVLTYYTPLAKSFFENGSENIWDDNNKHFYSHCKADYISGEDEKIVINPELTYNSPVHNGFDDSLAIVSSNSDERLNISGYRPEDAIIYEVDYEKLGFSKEDIITNALYVNADINMLIPEIQNTIFTLEDAGYTPKEIIDLYRKNIDFTSSENLDKLVKDKNCNIDELKKSDNSYKYNLTDYNCAVKPVSPIILANERKIRNEGMSEEQADKCRRDLGLPNIYDQKRYGKLNSDFYNDYINYIETNYREQYQKDLANRVNISRYFPDFIKDSDIYKSIVSASRFGVKGLAWLGMETADIIVQNAQRVLNRTPIADNRENAISQSGTYNYEDIEGRGNLVERAKNNQSKFDNKLKIRELKDIYAEMLPKDLTDNEKASQDENITYSPLIDYKTR